MIKKIKTLHLYYKETGFYIFLKKNVLKAILSVFLVVGSVIFINHFLLDIPKICNQFTSGFLNWQIILIFGISESLLGILPPDFFIIWSKQFNDKLLWLSILGFTSVCGGFTSYFIGTQLKKIKKLNKLIEKKVSKNLNLIKRWGGIVIIISCLFPLPYSPTCLSAGIIGYPFSSFWYLASLRFIRFYIYGNILLNTL